jgi:hypothetical protein
LALIASGFARRACAQFSSECPTSDRPSFALQAHDQSVAVATSSVETDDQAFIDELGDDGGNAARSGTRPPEAGTPAHRDRS